MSDKILITGSTGFIGKRLLSRLFRSDSNSCFYLLVRSSPRKPIEKRTERILQELSQEATTPIDEVRERVEIIEGDISKPQFGLSDPSFTHLAKEIDTIFHSAASVQLELAIEKSRTLNLLGTQTAIELGRKALQHGGFKRLNHVSTAYVAGQRKGLILEDELDEGQGFNNPYEQVKLEAEKEIRNAMQDIPISVFRPSIVMGDSETGWTPNFNVLYGPMKLAYFGKLHYVPGSKQSKVDTIPVDYVEKAICHLSSLSEEVIGKTFHITVGAGQEISTDELRTETTKWMHALIDEYELQNPRITPKALPPVLFKWVCNSAVFLLRGARKRVWQRFQTYMNYTLYPKQFDTCNAKDLLEPEGITCPPLVNYLEVIVRYCIETHFGVSDKPRDVL